MLEVINREKEKTHQEEIAHAAKAEPEAQRGTRATRSEGIMKPTVKIVRRGRDESRLQVVDERKTASSCEREIISTVKSWIAEGQERRRLSERKNWELLIKFAQ